MGKKFSHPVGNFPIRFPTRWEFFPPGGKISCPPLGPKQQQNSEKQTKQETLLKEFSKSETKYIKTIKKWLQNEKEYFASVVPIINQKVLPQATKVETIKAFKLKGLQSTIKDKAINLHNTLVIKKYLNDL